MLYLLLAMENINYLATEKTPEVNFDFQKGEFLVRGISIPENTVDFYHGLIFALREYAKDPQPNSILRIGLEYFNTSTSVIILKILNALEMAESSKVEVIWYYEEDDIEMEEVGLDFKEMTSVSFNLHPVEDLYAV